MNHLKTVSALKQTINEPKSMGAFHQIAVIALLFSGILFFLYPTLRPFSDETTLQGAAAFASLSWLLSHVLGIIAFMLLPVGLLGLYDIIENKNAQKTAFYGFLFCYVGMGCTLPFYGAEVFALDVIGQEALNQNRDSVLELANAIRFGPGFLMILIGLTLLAIGSALVAISIWRSGTMTKWAGIPLALGFILYLPQYVATQPLRIIHGLVIAIGCIWIALVIWKHRYKERA
ncbi:hypothetical protein [Bacillus sp. AK128]